MRTASPNFAYLAYHDSRLVALATQGEQHFRDDPTVILRMADLLAPQPNMDIRLHIVAPEARKEKVFVEIRRPVFSLTLPIHMSSRLSPRRLTSRGFSQNVE